MLGNTSNCELWSFLTVGAPAPREREHTHREPKGE